MNRGNARRLGRSPGASRPGHAAGCGMSAAIASAKSGWWPSPSPILPMASPSGWWSLARDRARPPGICSPLNWCIPPIRPGKSSSILPAAGRWKWRYALTNPNWALRVCASFPGRCESNSSISWLSLMNSCSNCCSLILSSCAPISCKPGVIAPESGAGMPGLRFIDCVLL
jgi:hypothetical protein